MSVKPSRVRHPTEAGGPLPAGLEDQGSGAPNRACHLSLSLLPWKMGLWLMSLLRKCLSRGWHLGTVTPGLGAEPLGQARGQRQGLPGSGGAGKPSTAGSRLISCGLTSLHYGACRRCSLISLLNYELGSGSLCSCSRLVIPTTLFPYLLIKPGALSCNKHFKRFF